MSSRFAAIAALLIPTVFLSAADSTPKLDGRWVGGIMDPNGTGTHMKMEIVIKGDTMVSRKLEGRGDPDLGEGTYTLTPGSPGRLDAVRTSQPKGQKYPGIYKLEGDTLKWCVKNVGFEPPKEFQTRPHESQFYLELTRQK